MTRRRVWRAAVAVAACAAAAMSGSARAAADPGPAGGDDVMAMQMRLIAAADQISAATPGTDGFAGISVEAEAGELRLYWKGDLPEQVRREVDEQRAYVSAAVLAAPYSERELAAASDAIIRADGVTGVAPLTDGSALLVSVAGDERSGWELPAVRSAAVPVVIEPYEKPIFSAGRQHDTAPYAGGSMYHWPLGDGYIGLCTTGFGVQVSGVNKILSAGHCRDNGDNVYEGNSTGTEVTMGTVSGDDNTHDTLLIDADSTGVVYDGPYTSTTSKPIHTVIGNYANTLVCTSGSMTGQHCHIRITGVNQTIKVADDNGGTYLITSLVRAQHDSKGVAVGQGDSGGPVVAQDSFDDFTLVYPLGTVTAQDGLVEIPCGASQYPTHCSWRMYYADINLSLARYSATIVG